MTWSWVFIIPFIYSPYKILASQWEPVVPSPPIFSNSTPSISLQLKYFLATFTTFVELIYTLSIPYLSIFLT